MLVPEGFLGVETPFVFSIVEIKKLLAGRKGVTTCFVPNSNLVAPCGLSPSKAAYANCKSILPALGVTKPETGIFSK
ncbi:hypothetical protein D3C86_2015780 [compost metagenome]